MRRFAHASTLILSAAALAACGAAEDPVAVETADGDVVVVDDVETIGADESLVAAVAPEVCDTFGPQTPRDISSPTGVNATAFPMAMDVSDLNLCNIHTHTNAEHKGPGFSVATEGLGEYGGYQCNMTSELTEAELAPYDDMDFGKVKPGDTIEVHWVHTSCDVEPGVGLGACVPEGCTDPLLRVETQVFAVVNDRSAADFLDYVDVDNASGTYQASVLPTGTGDPVVFRGSTTGPSYDAGMKCSPAKVTWSVRPQCMKLDIATLDAWAEQGNVFEETKSHGVRPLVTDERMLSPIDN